MSTTVAAFLATLITTGMTSAVSHQFTMLGGCCAALLMATYALVRPDSRVHFTFLLGAVAMSLLALISAEVNRCAESSTIHVLACYLALLSLAFSTPHLSSFCQQLMLFSNILLTTWIIAQAGRVNAFEAWAISNPAGAGNLMAAQINMTIPLVIANIATSPGPRKGVFAALLAANILAVFLVMSRNGIGAMLALLVLYVLFNHKRLAICIIFPMLTAIVFLDSLLQIPFIHALLVRFRIIGFKPVAPRSLIWEVSTRYIFERPVFGVGPGKPKIVLAILDINHAHNNLVQVALETGIPSACFYVFMMAAILILPVRAIFGRRELFLPTLSILAYLAFSLTAGPLVFPGATLLLAACVNEARVGSGYVLGRMPIPRSSLNVHYPAIGRVQQAHREYVA
jgi:O-antigen ligase